MKKMPTQKMLDRPHHLLEGYEGIPNRQLSIVPRFQGVLPSEVADNIVAIMLKENHRFSIIANFSRASYQFRQIAFRRYFYCLNAPTKLKWHQLCQIPKVFIWVRVITASTTALCSSLNKLGNFVYLNSISIDYIQEGLHTQYTSSRFILTALPSLKLTHLELRCLPRIDTALLRLIAANCPRLEELSLSCNHRLVVNCCWSCYEQSATGTIFSPIPDYFTGIEDLAVSFSNALKSLRYLRHLELGVFLSHEDIFYEHIEHASTYDHTSHSFQILPATRPYPLDQCKQCQDAYARDVREIELSASSIIAHSFPFLETVTWATFFPADPLYSSIGGGGDDESSSAAEANAIVSEGFDGSELITTRANQQANFETTKYCVQRLQT